AAANIMHALNHSVGDYAKRLQNILKNPVVRSNKEAFEFLEYTNRSVSKWIDELEAHTLSFRRKEPITEQSVDAIVQDVIDTWYRKASSWKCSLASDVKNRGLRIRVRPGALKEALSCMVINS